MVEGPNGETPCRRVACCSGGRVKSRMQMDLHNKRVAAEEASPEGGQEWGGKGQGVLRVLGGCVPQPASTAHPPPFVIPP